MEWLTSFLLAVVLTFIFCGGEFLREIDREDKTIKEGFNHLTSRCDYRIIILFSLFLNIVVITLCIKFSL